MKNSKGLKGTTDALAHCKSMYAKGGSAGKNQMIRSMKSYEIGGTTQSADLGDDLKRGWRKVKRAVRNTVNSMKNPSHTPTFKKSKCGGAGCWN
jgi:hypothetical protein